MSLVHHWAERQTCTLNSASKYTYVFGPGGSWSTLERTKADTEKHANSTLRGQNPRNKHGTLLLWDNSI